VSASPNGHLLDCRDLHAYYGESYILHGISFTVERNEILALLGRNGAGKTTTLRTIARARQPTLRRGEIYLDGAPLHPAARL
jgi:branched-chain amino acid transport system ATP-binding protein